VSIDRNNHFFIASIPILGKCDYSVAWLIFNTPFTVLTKQ